jgi:UDP-GlcNAc:undecaprenyl-phosphate GlcNAc-1-phosphate transferase
MSLTFHTDLLAFVTVGVVVTVLVSARLFGHAEFNLVKEWLLCRFVRRGGEEARHLEVRLQGSRDWGGLWRRIKTYADELDLQSVQLDINAPAIHESFFARWQRQQLSPASLAVWRMEVPLWAENGLLLGRVLLVGGEAGQAVPARVLELTSLLGGLAVRDVNGAGALGRPHLARAPVGAAPAPAGEEVDREAVPA